MWRLSALAAVTGLGLYAPAAVAAPAASEQTQPAPAQQPVAASPDAAAGAPRVLVHIAADTDELDALERVLRELLQRLAVVVEVTPIARVDRAAVAAPSVADPGDLARCFIDLRAPGSATLYVHDVARDRVLERRLPRADGSNELVREQLGHMLLGAIEALRAGAMLGAPRAELLPDEAQAPPAKSQPPPEELQSPPSEAAQHAHWQLRGAVLYEVSALGHEPGLTHGPLLAGQLLTPLRPQLGLLLSAQYRLAYETDADPLGLRLQSIALRALATVEGALSGRVLARAGLGGGADIARLTPETSDDAGIALTRQRTLALGVARALLGLDFRVSKAIALWVALAADVDLDRTRYVLVRDDASESAVTTPWRLRPAFMLGAALP